MATTTRDRFALRPGEEPFGSRAGTDPATAARRAERAERVRAQRADPDAPRKGDAELLRRQARTRDRAERARYEAEEADHRPGRPRQSPAARRRAPISRRRTVTGRAYRAARGVVAPASSQIGHLILLGLGLVVLYLVLTSAGALRGVLGGIQRSIGWLVAPVAI